MDARDRGSAYVPLEVVDRDGRKINDRRVYRSAGVQHSGLCFTFQSFLPDALSCSQPGLQVAYDALEEDYTDLEQR